MGRQYTQAPLADRFWTKVVKRAGCWDWSGSKDRKGYGRLNSGGGHGQILLAHRVSWRLHYGDIPSDYLVCHRCDTPACSNPAHLFLGTVKDNAVDSVVKGRQARGIRNGIAKVTEEQVREMRRRYVDGGITMQALADDYGLSIGAVHAIIHRKNWRHA